VSLLTIVQDTCDLLALVRPSIVIGTTDDQIRQLHAICIEEADDLVSSFNWQALLRQHTFTTVAAAEQIGAIPDDLDRFIPNSFFNRTTRRPVLGPITPQLWQNIQANPQINRVILAYRERDGAFLITPDPPADQVIAFEYSSTEWARSALGDFTYTKWQNDTDTSFVSEKLIKLGARWRWRKAKGLPYAEDFDTYTQQKEQTQARDGGSSVLNITGGGDWVYVGNPNVPETGFGAA
jgi:hypothetical protein